MLGDLLTLAAILLLAATGWRLLWRSNPLPRRRSYARTSRTVTFYGPGEQATTAVLGSLVLVRHGGPLAWLIRFGQRIRFYGPYRWCNHAAIIVDATPGAIRIAEATARGMVVSPLEHYAHLAYAIVAPDVEDVQHQATADYALSTCGWRYAFLTILGEVVYVLTGIPLMLGLGRSVICSGDATMALIASGLKPSKLPPFAIPADLARWYNVELPAGIG